MSDFFGIEYNEAPKTSSNDTTSKSSQSHHSKSSESSSTNSSKSKELSGTEFLDASFFPELTNSKKYQRNEEGDYEKINNDENEGHFFPDKNFVRQGKRAQAPWNTAHSSKELESSANSKNLSGTEFLDEAFFPDITNSKRYQRDEEGDYEKTSIEDKNDPFLNNFVAESRGKRKKASSDSLMKLQVISEAEYYPDKEKGFEQILNSFEPVWKYSHKELVDSLSQKIIYNSEDLIAFDKPYQLAFAGSKKAEMDKVLQDVKQVVAKDAERLQLLKPLDKACTGVVLFAKNAGAHKKYAEILKTNRVNFEYRTIVKNVPKVREAEIKVPVRRFLKGQDFELRPLIATTKERVFYPLTTYRILEEAKKLHCSYLNVDVQNEIPHQIRCHLGYGIGCPILGDIKYSKIGDNFTQNLSTGILARLELNRNQARKLPMYLHLREVRIPENSSGSKYISIRAAIPDFFKFTLKRLSLLKK